MIEWMRRAVEWLGFTPTHRERLLAARLASTIRQAEVHRLQVQRIESLLAFRERMGAETIETPAIRLALYGEERDR